MVEHRQSGHSAAERGRVRVRRYAEGLVSAEFSVLDYDLKPVGRQRAHGHDEQSALPVQIGTTVRRVTSHEAPDGGSL